MPPADSKPTILVTGCSGLIGHLVCNEFAKKYTVVGLDRDEPQDDSSNIVWQQCDLTDEQSLSSALAAIRAQGFSRFASVVHLAAYYDFSGKESPLYEELTVRGTERLLRALHDFDSVEQFVFASSLLVMKPCELGEKLTEVSPTKAEWAYPESKLQAERVIKRDHKNIPAVILRAAGVYDEMGHSLPITQNIKRIAEKQLESYLFPGDSKRGQSFVHLADLVDCIGHVIERRKKLENYEVFLLAEQECLSYETLQDLIGELTHGSEDWPTIRIPKFVAKAGAWAKDMLATSEDDKPFIQPWMVDMADAHYPVDNSKARGKLDWHPQHQLSKTLPEIIDNLKADPEKWYRVNKLPLPDDRQVLEQVQA